MSFKAVNWSANELLGHSKTDQMSNNAEWLYNHTPRAIYTLPSGVRRTQGVRIVSGRAVIPAQKSDTAGANVRFGNFFSARCEPIITTGVVAKGQAHIFCVINGLGDRLQPDHTGFHLVVNVAAEKKANDKIARTMYVSYTAMGY